jgi:putative endonuclease
LSASERRARRGKQAEQYVVDLLTQRGYLIVHCNYRTRSGEIDIIALDDDVLVFVEVRARTGTAFGIADDTVTRPKLRRIMSTALAFIEEHPEYADSYWRVDLFALALASNGGVASCRQYENLTLD